MQLKSGTHIRKLQSLTELNVNCKSKFWMFITHDQLPQNIRCLSVECLFFFKWVVCHNGIRQEYSTIGLQQHAYGPYKYNEDYQYVGRYVFIYLRQLDLLLGIIIGKVLGAQTVQSVGRYTVYPKIPCSCCDRYKKINVVIKKLI